MSVSSAQRFTASKPCPVCGGYEGAERGNGSRCYGFFSTDGKYAHCAREEYAGDIELTESSGTYAHYLGGRCKCGETHDTVEVPSTNGKVSSEKKEAFFSPERDTVFYYRDLANKPLYAVVRMGGDKSKTFQAHKDGDKWYWGIPDGAPNVPYRLTEVVQAIAEGKPIDIFEGEPDADAARKLGLVATTNIRGAGKFTDDIVPYFRGADVRINADNDEDGRKHLEQVARQLDGTARSIKAMPPFPSVKDFRDWLEAGGTLDEYEKMVEETPEYNSGQTSTLSPGGLTRILPFRTVADIFFETEEPIPWVIKGFLASGNITELSGAPKLSGKTTLLLDATSCLLEGLPFLGMETKRSKVAFLTEQANNLKEALEIANLGPQTDGLYILQYKDVRGQPWPEITERVIEFCLAEDIGVFMTDTMAEFGQIDDENLVAPVREAMQQLKRAAQNHNLAVAYTRHFNKQNKGRGSSQFEADCDFYFTLKRPEGNHNDTVRVIHGEGRSREILKNTYIDLKESGYIVLDNEHGDDIQFKASVRGIRQVLPRTEENAKERPLIYDLLKPEGHSETTIKRALRWMVDQGIVTSKGRGVKGDPERFWLLNYSGQTNSGDKGPKEETPANNGKNKFGPNIEGIGETVDPNNSEATPDPKRAPKKKKHYTLLDLARADRDLATGFPNLIYREKQVPKVLEWLATAKAVGVDIETYGVAKLKGARTKLALSFVHGRIRLLQLSDGDTTYIIDTALLRWHAARRILEALRSKTLIIHGGVFDLPRLKRHYGVDLIDEDLVDTMVLSRLARSGELKDDGKPVEHNLGAVLRKEKVANIGKDTDHEWQEPLNQERLKYAIDDVRYLPALRDALMRVVEERNQLPGLKLFMPAYREYMRMQYRGVPLDLDRFNALLKKYRRRAEDALSRVEELAPDHPDGELFSWGNKLKPDHTDRYGNNTGRNGALRALQLVGTNIKSLKKENRTEYLRNHPDAKLLEALDEYYRYSDLHSDAKGWLTYAVEDGRLYPNINPFSQVTCRSAYSDPALQNIPKEPDEEGALSLRDCIRAPEGYKIVAADYAAQELRIVAHIADDTDLIKAFTQGDPHLQIAEKIAGKKLKRGTAEGEKYRKLGKNVNFGFTYGQGAARFQQSVYQKTSERISEDDAKAYQKAFQQTWRGVHRWQKRFGWRSGKKPEHWYTESFVGRRRYVSRKWDTELPGWKPTYTDRLNGPVQSGGADMLYTAVNLLQADQAEGKFEDAKVLLTTHDEIALEAPEGIVEDAKVWLEQRMRDAAKQFLREELAKEDCVEGEVGDSWGGK